MTKFDEIPLIAKLLTAGTSACVADTVTFPLDTAKVRLQIQGEGSGKSKSHFRYKGVFSTIATISKEEGPRSLYNGLSAGLQRQMCFASIRFGMYDTVKRFYQRMAEDPNKKSGSGVELLIRICAGITTGCLAVVVAQPTDIVKVRFQAQSGKNRKYSSTISAYRGLYNQEGIPGLWKGMFPNMARNAIVNVSEIVCYDIVKDAILHNKLMEDNIYCHFTSAVIAGFCTTLLSSPVDVIKTRYMNSPKGMYKSALDCAIKSIKEEGPTSMYKGFMPSFYRLVAWNIVMWITYEKLKRLVPLLFSDNKK